MGVLLTLVAFAIFAGLFAISGLPPKYQFLGTCFVWWACVFSYRFSTGRKFFEDIVGWVVAPLLPLRLIYLVAREGSGFVRRVILARKRSYQVKVRLWGDLVSDRATMTRGVIGLKLPIGYNDRRVVYANLDDDRHLAVMGTTGEGKTSVVLTMLLSILSTGQTGLKRINVSLHDPKRVLYNMFHPITSNEFGVFGSLTESIAELERLALLMNERTAQLGRERAFSVDEIGLPHILVVIDEPQIYFNQDREYEKLVYNLVTVGRQAGIHVLLVTPYAKGDVISTKYRVNLKYISGYLPKHAESVLQMPVSSLGEHEFLYQKNERATPVHMWSFEITPGDVSNVINSMTAPSQFLAHATPEDIALRVFMTTPNCGVRTLLKQARMIADVGGGVPYPLDGVITDKDGVSISKDALNWGLDFLRKLTDLGVASDAPNGKARKPLVSYEQAKILFR